MSSCARWLVVEVFVLEDRCYVLEAEEATPRSEAASQKPLHFQWPSAGRIFTLKGSFRVVDHLEIQKNDSLCIFCSKGVRLFVLCNFELLNWGVWPVLGSSRDNATQEEGAVAGTPLLVSQAKSSRIFK
jgi:hypothetical protein